MTIAIVTDSTADLPKDVLVQHHIETVPVFLIVNDQTYVDGEGISREEFYAQLPTYQRPPTTSAPSIPVFQQVYDRVLRGGASQVLSIHVSSAWSGTYNIACSAARSFQDKVRVLDSGQVSLGLGFQVLAAAEKAACGATMEELHRLIASINKKVRFIALLDTLEYLRRSGRVHWAAVAVSNFLNLKVMIDVRNGEVLRLGLFRAHRQGVAKLIDQMKRLGPLENLALVYTHLANPEELSTLLAEAKDQVRGIPLITPVTSVIGTHVGPNGIGFIAVQA